MTLTPARLAAVGVLACLGGVAAQDPGDPWYQAIRSGDLAAARAMAGVPSENFAYQRGVHYLLDTQQPDGSWHVASRSPKFQPYFESGFPHGQDQWISQAGTAWAATALAYAVNDPQASSKNRTNLEGGQ